MSRRARVPKSEVLTAVRSAVAAVEDPELHLGLGEAGMIEDVHGSRHGGVEVVVRLTTASCPMREHLVAAITTAACSVPGVTHADVRFTTMPEGDRTALAARLRAAGGIRRGPLTADPGPLVYAVASGKGGVGKSVVTANLATALAGRGRRVGVLDADVWGYSVPQLFGVRRPPVALNGLMLPVEAHGVALMSVGFLVEDDQPVVWRGPMLHKAIDQLLTDVHWGDLDVLLLDLPPGTGDVTLSVLEFLPDAQLLVVTTPQRAARVVATRVGRMAQDVRMPIAGVIENMSTHICSTCHSSAPLFGSGGGLELAYDLDVHLLGQVPLDPELGRSADAGIPVVRCNPSAPSAVELARIATQLPGTVRPSLLGRALPLSVV